MNNADTSKFGHRWGWHRKGGGAGGHHGRGWSGPPWMRFMGEGGGPGGPRSPRMFGQGDLRLLLLALIADRPSHGYDLIRTIEAKFNGNYAPSAGTIYPTLTLLEEQELIAPESEGAAKKSYVATAKGLAHLREHAETVQALMRRIEIMAEGGGGPPPMAIMHAIHTLRSAIMARAGASPDEQDRIRTIIENAARNIMGGK
jgi:DNA-binding PadR family transcriptional regulator